MLNKNIKLNKDKILMIKRFNKVKDKYNYVRIVPATIHNLVMDFAHHSTNMQHFGQDHTVAKVRSYYWWPNFS